MSERFFSVGEAARRLSVSTPTIRGWVKAGTLRAYKLGGQVRIKETDLDALVDASRIEPSSSPVAVEPRRPAPPAGGLRDLLESRTRRG